LNTLACLAATHRFEVAVAVVVVVIVAVVVVLEYPQIYLNSLIELLLLLLFLILYFQIAHIKHIQPQLKGGSYDKPRG
jgi:cobalamin biosynthesis protein CobD/CbiB